jgi:plastocyanin
MTTKSNYWAFKILSFTFLIMTTIFYMFSTPVVAEEKNLQPHLHKVVLSNSTEGISPSIIRLKQGDTVVWYNTDKEPVVISFLEKLGIVCSPIINFYADPSGAYRTQAIPLGGTASLCFIRQGEYEYKVKRVIKQNNGKSTEHIVKGKIIVEEQ